MRAVDDGMIAVRPNGDAKLAAVAAVDGECEPEQDVVEIDGEESAEARRPRKMADPLKPTAAEVEEHCVTHLPYRSWCWTCVHGRGKHLSHTRGSQERKIHELHFDFMFMGRKDEPGETVTCLVVREVPTRMTLSTMVPSKAASTFVVQRVLAFLDEIGCKNQDVVAKCDQEPSMKKLVEDIGRARAVEGGGRWVTEHSPVGASASNGVVERGIQSVEGQVRVLKLALEKRWNVEIPSSHPVVPWVVEYASYLLNRYEVGHDGKTAYERLKGKSSKGWGIEFGEGLHWKASSASSALGKLSASWRDGVYLGVKGKSGEIIVSDADGVWKTRSVRRKPQDERWDESNVDMVKTSPWSSKGDTEGGASETPAVAVRMRDDEYDAIKRAEPEENIPRNFYITTKNLEDHGYSAGCPGCLSISRGKARQAHSAACRKRFESLVDAEKVQKADTRIVTYLAKQLEKADEQRVAKKARISDDRLKNGGQVDDVRIDSDVVEDARDRDAKRAKIEHKNSDALMGSGTTSMAPQASGAGPSGLTEVQRQRIPVQRDDDRGTDPDEAVRKKAKRQEDVARLRVDMEIMGISDGGDDEHVDDMVYEQGDIWDGRSGVMLDPELVKVARKEELAFMRKIELFEEVAIEQCWNATGRAPIGTKWVDTDKGSEENPDVRCRLVARDFKPKGEKDRSDLFASTPPLEAKKLLFALAASQPRMLRTGRMVRQKLMFIDIKKAHLNGVVGPDEHAYVALPPGCCRAGYCGRLKRWLYGMRPAASAWEADYTERLHMFGMEKGVSVPTAFYHEGRQLRCIVHGDDFTFLGWQEDLDEVTEHLRETYELKVRGIMGGEPNDCQEIRILGRMLKWKGDVMEYEADTKHAEMVWEELGMMANSNGLDKPCVRETAEEAAQSHEPLEVGEATRFRALAARANFLSLDRPDVQFAVKELCRDMAAPSTGSWQKLKRLARYLVRYPRLVWDFSGRGAQESSVEVFTDSDWAGCLRTRKSTSGGVLMYRGVVIKHWSSTQPTIALSVGEAEYVALAKGATEALGAQSLAADLGLETVVRVSLDSATAKSIASRSGVGKVRHLDTKQLWVQEAVRTGRLFLRKVRGDANPANLLTKPLSVDEMMSELDILGARVLKCMK